MDCKKAEELIFTDYIDAKLAGPALKDIEAHLSSCSRCHELASELASMRKTFGAVGPKEAPPEVWQKIRDELALHLNEVNGAGFVPPVPAWFVRLRPALVAAAAAAVIFAVLMIGRLMPYNAGPGLPAIEEDIISLAALDENGNGANYDFGTPAENYFL